MTTFLILPSLKACIMPPGINILLALMGLSIYFYNRKIAIIFFWVSILTLWLFSAPIFAYNLIEILQNQYRTLLVPTNSLGREKGVIVVLGGGDSIYVEQSNKHAVSDVTLNRIRYAAYLHKKINLPIIVSGGRARGAKESEADLMLTCLQDNFGVMTAIKEDKSKNTADESKFIAKILKEKRFDIVYLVTNAWHMPRSVRLFERQGIRVIPAPMGYESYDHHYTILSYIPNVQALSASAIALHELIGLLL